MDSIEQVIAQMTRMGVSASVENLIMAAYELGKIANTRDILMDLEATDVNTPEELADYAPAVEAIRANYPVR